MQPVAGIPRHQDRGTAQKGQGVDRRIGHEDHLPPTPSTSSPAASELVAPLDGSSAGEPSPELVRKGLQDLIQLEFAAAAVPQAGSWASANSPQPGQPSLAY
jgi:hypothetical protein